MRRTFTTALLLTASMFTNAAGTADGVPVAIQKTDFGSLHLTFIQFNSGFDSSIHACSSSFGLVLKDTNESAELGVTLALTALASSKKFSCFVRDECSQVNGQTLTYPVCDLYPSILND